MKGKQRSLEHSIYLKANVVRWCPAEKMNRKPNCCAWQSLEGFKAQAAVH